MEGKHSPKHAAPTRSSRRAERPERAEHAERSEYRRTPVREREYDPAPEKKSRRNRPVWQLIIQDILLTGLVLCVFATFHHVIPRLTAKNVQMPTPSSVINTPAPAETPAPEDTAEPENTPEPTPEVIDNRTEWQKKFEEHFTDEVIVTENSYTSPNVSITMSTITIDDPSPTVCYVADIYIAQIENFQTYWANGQLSYYGEESSLSMAANSGAILSINGDYADNQRSGFLVRNGELYYSDQTTYDICVLYYDGTMETFSPSEYTVDDILAKTPYQVWKFGPQLLDEYGQPRQSYNTSDAISWENPRSGIGYFEPGHYCLVLTDGTRGSNTGSAGVSMAEFAELLVSLGCTSAYNLDGGETATMMFGDRLLNDSSRRVTDGIYITEPVEGGN